MVVVSKAVVHVANTKIANGNLAKVGQLIVLHKKIVWK
jgi:hypothetical protein